jgi:hypothetical protein
VRVSGHSLPSQQVPHVHVERVGPAPGGAASCTRALDPKGQQDAEISVWKENRT